MNRLRADLALITVGAFSAVALVAATALTRPSSDVGPLAALTSDAAVAAADQRPALDYEDVLAALDGRLTTVDTLTPALAWASIPLASAGVRAPGAGAGSDPAGAAPAGAVSAAPAGDALVAVPSEGGGHEHGDGDAHGGGGGHGGGDRQATTVASYCALDANSDRCKKGERIDYEPASQDGKHSAALRYVDGGPDHHNSGGACTPTPDQNAFGDWLIRETQRTLVARYKNNPAAIVADGFYAYPVPDSKWLHIINNSRINDGDYVAGKNPRVGDPRSGIFNPARIESFMMAMTDDGLVPVGGMYILPDKYKGAKKSSLPNPTGCLLQWHNHTGSEGLATSGDPSNPDQSVWMSHVWIYGGLDPWGRDYDGTQPHTWFTPYRNLPVLCSSTGCI